MKASSLSGNDVQGRCFNFRGGGSWSVARCGRGLIASAVAEGMGNKSLG